MVWAPTRRGAKRNDEFVNSRCVIDRKLNREIMRAATRIVFVHEWNLNLRVCGAARVCESKIAFGPDGFTVEIAEMQSVNER
jgi:hypothetical protein